jgi:DNA repair protein RecN (Recombination protein N)
MSIGRIHLRDFVIVKELEIDFSQGFTVLTGETGAGKSILIDALQIAFGARAEPGLIREGAQKAEICVEFTPPSGVLAWLVEHGFESAQDWLIKRIIDTQGKSRAWINASPVSATQLKELGEQLLDIHGQHAWQSLTKPQEVRALLDAYSGHATEPLKSAWQTWRDAQNLLQEALASQASQTQELERLLWQITELEKLNPQAHEWGDLSAQHQRLSNSQSLLESANGCLTSLQDEDTGVLSQLNKALHLLQSNVQFEPSFKDWVDVLSSSLNQAQDAAHSINSWLKHVDMDASSLEEIDQRMSLWMSLARRFKKPPEELAQVLAEWREQLLRLNQSLDIEALKAGANSALSALKAEAQKVTQSRRKAAPLLAQSITSAMQELGMQGGQFEVELAELLELSSYGAEDVSFLVAAHAGSTPKPVSKVASGGELSRIALAIAVTTSKLGSTPTLIFDEVDSGVGGAVAHTVGRLLRQLGQDRQVLAVTHLPQVASCANHHWVVSKLRTGDQTFSQVTCIEGPEREQEIARMLGGESATQTSLAHAKEMLDMQNKSVTATLETSKAKTSRPKSTDAAGPEGSKSLPSKKPRPSKTA